MKIEIEIGELSLDQIESLVAFLKAHQIPHTKQPILQQTNPMFDFVTFICYKNVGRESKT